MNKPKSIICDIDGTLALRVNRDHFDFEKAGSDNMNKPIKEIVNLFKENGYEILLVTGREERFRDITSKWLKTNNLNYSKLLMRENKDYRKDIIIKEEIYNSEIKNKYEVSFVIDDREQMIKMWEKLRLACIKPTSSMI